MAAVCKHRVNGTTATASRKASPSRQDVGNKAQNQAHDERTLFLTLEDGLRQGARQHRCVDGHNILADLCQEASNNNIWLVHRAISLKTLCKQSRYQCSPFAAAHFSSTPPFHVLQLLRILEEQEEQLANSYVTSV